MYSVLDPSRHRRMFQSIREFATTIFLFPVGEGGGKKIEKPLMFYMNSLMRLQKLSKGNSRTKMLANSWLFNFQSLTNFLPSFYLSRVKGWRLINLNFSLKSKTCHANEIFFFYASNQLILQFRYSKIRSYIINWYQCFPIFFSTSDLFFFNNNFLIYICIKEFKILWKN